MSAVQMVFSSAFILVVVVASFMGVGHVFLYFFQKFLNFCVQIYALGFRG